MRISSALISLLLAAAFCCLPGAVNAFALTVEDLCAAMPPENGAAADALFNQVLAEGDALIFALCDRIGPPEDTPDAGARFALYGLAKHVVGPGRETHRVRVTRIFEVALNRAGHPDVRRFFMEQLRFCGDNTTIRVLEPYVCDPDVYDDAVRCIASLGGLQGLASILLVDCPDGPDKSASIQNALLGLNAQPYYSPEETGLSAELLAAMALPESVEDHQRIAALCRESLQKELKPHYAAMVLQTLARVAGMDALPELLQAVQSPHRAYAGAALRLVGGLAGEEVSSALSARLEEFNENVRPQVVVLLGKRDDPAARQAVRDALKHPVEEVRLAAYDAVTRRSDPALAGPLMDALARAESDSERQAVKAAFLRLPGLEAAMQQEMLNRPADPGAYTPAEKVLYLEIIRERQATAFREVAIALMNDPDDGVRRAACGALAAVGEPGDLAGLYQYQLAAAGESGAEVARTALAGLAIRLQLEEEAVTQATTRLAGASGEDAVRLLKTLGTLGTPAALKALQDAAEIIMFAAAPQEDQARALLETLSGWQGPEGGEAVLALWQRLEEASLRLMALKQYIAHVRRSFKEPEQQRERLTVIEGLCKTDAERQEVAEVISRISPKGN